MACLHAFSDHHKDILVWLNWLFCILTIVESIHILVVVSVTVFVIIKDLVGSRSPEERATCIQVALPILLHDTVNDMSLHDIEGIQVLEIV